MTTSAGLALATGALFVGPMAIRANADPAPTETSTTTPSTTTSIPAPATTPSTTAPVATTTTNGAVVLVGTALSVTEPGAQSLAAQPIGGTLPRPRVLPITGGSTLPTALVGFALVLAGAPATRLVRRRISTSRA